MKTWVFSLCSDSPYTVGRSSCPGGSEARQHIYPMPSSQPCHLPGFPSCRSLGIRKAMTLRPGAHGLCMEGRASRIRVGHTEPALVVRGGPKPARGSGRQLSRITKGCIAASSYWVAGAAAWWIPQREYGLLTAHGSLRYGIGIMLDTQ